MRRDDRVPSADPMRGDLVRSSTSLAQAVRDPGESMPIARTWFLTLQTALVDLTLDGDRLLGRPRSSAGYTCAITPEWLAAWAAQNVAVWRHEGMDLAAWGQALDLLRGWVRERDRAAVAAPRRLPAEPPRSQPHGPPAGTVPHWKAHTPRSPTSWRGWTAVSGPHRRSQGPAGG